MVRLFSTLLLLSFSSLIWANLVVQSERNKVAETEAFSVRIILENDNNAPAPDIAPLKKDFEILGSSQSQQTSVINGHVSSKRTWSLTLMPRRAGSLTLPSLSAGPHQSQPIPIEVIPGDVANAGSDAPFILEAELDKESVSVQEQVILTLRLLLRVQPMQAGLADPNIDNARIVRMGEDTHSETFRNGQRYTVIERRFAIFPQQSGPLEIPGVLFSASVAAQSSPRSSFGSLFTQTRPVRIKSPALSLMVNSRQDGRSGPWLPASSLVLSEQWQPDKHRIDTGTPVIRQISINATGLSAAQLPELAMPPVAGLKFYPEPAQLNDQGLGDKIVGQRVQGYTVIAERPGLFTLPAIEIQWWDTQTNTQKQAQLPPRKIEVSGQAVASQPIQPPQQAQLFTPPQVATAPAAQVVESPSQTAPEESLPWPWISLGLFILWLLTMLLFWLRRDKSNTSPKSPEVTTPDPSQNLKLRQETVMSAAKDDDPKLTREALIAWGRARWPEQNITGLDQIHTLVQEPTVHEALHALDAVLYAREPQSWNGASWLKGLQALWSWQDPDDTPEATTLAPMYPKT